MKKVIFVCTGNTCRSPMAEAILKHLLKQRGIRNIRVKSCGVAAHTGDSISENAKKALLSLGINPGRHKSAQCEDLAISGANMIVTMTEAHMRFFGDRKNVYSIGSLTGMGDIADPYGHSEEVYLLCALQIKKACEKLLNIIV